MHIHLSSAEYVQRAPKAKHILVPAFIAPKKGNNKMIISLFLPCGLVDFRWNCLAEVIRISNHKGFKYVLL